MTAHTSNLEPIFIIGSPRSGTTMLAGLLKRTPWGDPFETQFIIKYYKQLGQYDLADSASFRRLAGRILSERAIAQRRLNLTPEQLEQRVTRRDYAGLIDAIGRTAGQSEGHPSWGDKTPHYITNLDVIHSLFPRSKMLYIVRDGRDVAMSLLDRAWGPATVYTAARQWQHENEARPILATLRAGGLLHDVKYEELLAQPLETLRGIMRFLDQDVGDAALKEIAAPIRPSNAGKWESKMAPSDVEVFERVAGETLRRFDYPVTHAPGAVKALAALSFTTQDQIKHWRNLFVMNVVDTIRIRFFGKEPFGE